MKNRVAYLLMAGSLGLGIAIGSGIGFFTRGNLESRTRKSELINLQISSDSERNSLSNSNGSFRAVGNKKDVSLLYQEGTFTVHNNVELRRGSRWHVKVGYDREQRSYFASGYKIGY
ncbi:hypothetical protein GF386_01205 [Candidatus Pacearchaeota archaeon]|nr:hypothetical protein [Candidatus Pacearchaeota archaeon]